MERISFENFFFFFLMIKVNESERARIVRYLENINNNIVMEIYIYICFQGDEIGGLKRRERGFEFERIFSDISSTRVAERKNTLDSSIWWAGGKKCSRPRLFTHEGTRSVAENFNPRFPF